MGNVNQLIFWVLIPLLIFSYVTFRIIEWQFYEDGGRKEIAQQHSVNLSNLNDINCLVLGGSNAYFSLSAEELSKDDKLNCYNLSLLNEGYSDQSYFDFIKSMPIDRIKISYIFYSTKYILGDENTFSERLKNNKNNIGITGDSSFKLFGVSMASRLKNFLEGKSYSHSYIQYPISNERGDFKFEFFECATERIGENWTLTLELDELKNWIKLNLSRFQNLFQNAQVYLVLPSMLARNFNSSEFADLSNYLKAEAANHPYTYIEQSMFLNSDFLCDGALHTNKVGRNIRTSELLDLINSE